MECNTRYEDKRVEWYVHEKKDGKNIYQWVTEKPETNDVNDKAAKFNKNDGSKKSHQSKVSTYTRYCDNPQTILMKQIIHCTSSLRFIRKKERSAPLRETQ